MALALEALALWLNLKKNSEESGPSKLWTSSLLSSVLICILMKKESRASCSVNLVNNYFRDRSVHRSNRCTPYGFLSAVCFGIPTLFVACVSRLFRHTHTRSSPLPSIHQPVPPPQPKNREKNMNGRRVSFLPEVAGSALQARGGGGDGGFPAHFRVGCGKRGFRPMFR